MFIRDEFETERNDQIQSLIDDEELNKLSKTIIEKSDKYKYGYYWNWLGLPIIQMPEDIVLTQELLWDLKPDYIIEAGVAWGGSLAMYASFMSIYGGKKIFGIDLVIPKHNEDAILSIPNSNLIELIKGSSTSREVFEYIKNQILANSKILVILDSNHSHNHVLEELKLWSTILKKGDYVIVSDTIVEYISEQKHRPRPWGPGNNPATALNEFLKENFRFSQDNKYNMRTLLSFNPNGYLECISD